MTLTTIDTDAVLGIAEVARLTGLSQDTLRWYEREGLLPPVDRGPDGRRRYTARHASLLRLIVRLRRTGMPTKEMREFSRLVTLGAASHGARLRLLLGHRERILRHMAELREDLASLDDKIDHYRRLIADGLDCDGAPVDMVTAASPQETTLRSDT